ncbi:TonB-dependent receptor [Janthinobacterium sp.]|uniref:STN domain-containing protein n=1 Tax=Janthinobacterium sp. TaxID=1871054 RepID=UPI002585A5C3|nr:TonB-dependent receptor [Janthinobacterium sp.]MCX7290278.1 TonB-dependent receptor plug domain-containing protein [Janthinobacterium sp.]
MPPLLMRQIPLAVLLLSCAAPAVLAQTPSVQTAPATMRYDVPVQPLNASLIAIASRGGVRISIDAELARGVSAAPVQGDFTAEQALRRALQGTQLALLKTDSGVYTVQRAVQAAASPEATMPEVLITTNYLGQVTEDTGSYTTGAVSTANRLVLSPRETPHAISVVTRQQMDDFGLVQLSEVLNHTPGVYVQHIDSERTIYYCRGRATRP